MCLALWRWNWQGEWEIDGVRLERDGKWEEKRKTVTQNRNQLVHYKIAHFFSAFNYCHAKSSQIIALIECISLFFCPSHDMPFNSSSTKRKDNCLYFCDAIVALGYLLRFHAANHNLRAQYFCPKQSDSLNTICCYARTINLINIVVVCLMPGKKIIFHVFLLGWSVTINIFAIPHMIRTD